MQEIHVRHRFPHRCDEVFAVLGDHQRCFALARMDCQLLRNGAPLRDGDGCVRQIRKGALCFTETISNYRPAQGFDYHVQSLRWGPLNIPFRHRRGWLELQATADGCEVVWRSQFSLAIPLLGPALERRFAQQAGAAFARILRCVERALSAAPASD